LRYELLRGAQAREGFVRPGAYVAEGVRRRCVIVLDEEAKDGDPSIASLREGCRCSE
jgi:hypothetical protein